jgi:hypothetical protein
MTPMTDLELLKDRMLESENLTDNLQDDDARWLLDWGVDRLRELDPNESSEVAEEKAGALMKFMRGLNRLAGGLPGVDPERLPGLLNDYAAAFGASRAADEAGCHEAASSVSSLSQREALEFLIDWARPA